MLKLKLHNLDKTTDIYEKREWILQNLDLIRREINGLKLRDLTTSKYHALRDLEKTQLQNLNANNSLIMINEQLKLTL